MAAFLGIKPSRLEWAGKEGIIERDEHGRYPCETVTAQWLDYERALHAKGGKRSEFERQRARLTRAKAEAAERKLAMLDRALVGTGDILERTKAVCLHIKSKLQAAFPRIARRSPIGRVKIVTLPEPRAVVTIRFAALINGQSRMRFVIPKLGRSPSRVPSGAAKVRWVRTSLDTY
jgi:hypothetical protein